MFYDQALGQDKTEKVSKDGMRDRNLERKKTLQAERGPHPDWQSAMVYGSESAFDETKRMVSSVKRNQES